MAISPQQLGYSDEQDPRYIKAVELEKAYLLIAETLNTNEELRDIWTSNFRVNIMAAWQSNNHIDEKDKQWLFVNCQKAAEWCMACVIEPARQKPKNENR